MDQRKIKMIKFASSVIPVGQLFPKANRKKFVKIAQYLSREDAIRKLAAIMHNEYVDKMKATEYAGQDNPQRMRDDKTGSGQQINILQDFENLTPKWQEENLKAAEVAYDLVKANIDDIDNKMEEIADKIHQAWSARNSYSELAKKTYAELPKEEKDKDRHQVELAKKLIMGQTDINDLGKGDKESVSEPNFKREERDYDVSKYRQRYTEPKYELTDEPDPSSSLGLGSKRFE